MEASLWHSNKFWQKVCTPPSTACGTHQNYLGPVFCMYSLNQKLICPKWGGQPSRIPQIEPEHP
eukprot:6519722-Ditylum_brightwellii.AAC.1